MKKRKAEEGERVYRILAILGGFTLSELGKSITDAFDFDYDHVLGFYDNIESWTSSVERYESRHTKISLPFLPTYLKIKGLRG